MAQEDNGATVPLMLYPPGFPTNNLNIFATTDVFWLPSDAESGGPIATGGIDTGSPLDPQPTCFNMGFYRVVRNGVWLFGLTNGTVLSGIVSVPVEAGSLDGTPLHTVTLSANGEAIEGTPNISQPFPGQLIFNVDTRRLSNGDYYFQAGGTWYLPFTNIYDTSDFKLYSPPVFVTVSNQISYPDWVQDFRDGLMLINAIAAITNIDWRVDIYGQNTNLVRTFTNHSPDGLIQVSWDLKDANGVAQTDNAFMAVTTVSPSNSPAITDTNPPLIKVVDTYPDQGRWIVARAEYIPSTIQNYDYYTNTINGFAQMGETGGGVLPGSPYRNSGQALFLSAQSGITNWAALVRAFTNRTCRNFYFDGHGGPDEIGPGYDTNGEPTRSLTADVAAQFLGNTTPSTNSIRYRWVWIDGCDSALGVWPQTFGLGNRENVALTNYVSRPGAFCGFDAPVYGWTHGIGGIDIKTINYRGYFVQYWWLAGRGVRDAFDGARDDSGDFGTDSHLKVYGYWGLGWSQYNTKPEWPP
jgi:hypothetical protein